MNKTSLFPIKLILSNLICVFINHISFSQEQLDFGIIGGLNFSNVIGADVSGNNLRIGPHLGGYAEIPYKDNLGFRAELHLLSTKGTATGRFRSLYIDIPLLATYQLDNNFKLLAGIQPSVLLNAKVRDGSNRGTITRDIRTIDFGFIFGGWYQIDRNWSIGARIVPGILRVGADGNERTFNFNFQLSVGYLLPKNIFTKK